MYRRLDKKTRTKNGYAGDPLRERCLALADHVIATGETVRRTAARFGKSKSTVHKDVTERLRFIDRARWAKVRRVLETNRAERHIRGGEATKRKYRDKTEQRREEK